MSDPHSRGDISVTMKHDGREGSWTVFKGTPAQVREDIIEYFALEDSEHKDSPLFDLVNEATRLYKAAGNLNAALGGRVLPNSKGEGKAATGSAWEQAANEPVIDPIIAHVTAALEAAADVAAVKGIYARNKVHFDAHPELMAVYSARGKALSS